MLMEEAMHKQRLKLKQARLLERGVEVGEIRHKTPIGAWDGGFEWGDLL
jgi:hypothetical protein